MQKIMLITGATDGIGLVTAHKLVEQGHQVLLHGRNASKLQALKQQLEPLSRHPINTYCADFSDLTQVKALAQQLLQEQTPLDVLINNAGVFQLSDTRTAEGLDIRFVVNTLAPYLLTLLLQPLFSATSRIVNLSSAAQASVNIDALLGQQSLNDNEAYAQSKLALSIWSQELGLRYAESGPMLVAVNPKSFLGSKMVKEAYGVAGGDLAEGADILIRASLSSEFAKASGQYFDNDINRFSQLHPESQDIDKVSQIMQALECLVADYLS